MDWLLICFLFYLTALARVWSGLREFHWWVTIQRYQRVASCEHQKWIGEDQKIEPILFLTKMTHSKYSFVKSAVDLFLLDSLHLHDIAALLFLHFLNFTILDWSFAISALDNSAIHFRHQIWIPPTSSFQMSLTLSTGMDFTRNLLAFKTYSNLYIPSIIHLFSNIHHQSYSTVPILLLNSLF